MTRPFICSFILTAASVGAAPQSWVVLDKAGSDPNTPANGVLPYCDPGNQYVAQGRPFAVRFEGHSTTNTRVRGTLRLTQYASAFRWENDVEPTPMFPAQRGLLGSFTLIAPSAYTEQTPQFRAVDSRGVTSDYRTCRVWVRPYLIRLEVNSLTFDPSRGRLVMRITNQSEGEANVPWSIYGIRRSPMSGRSVSLASGHQDHVAAHHSFEVTAAPPPAGEYILYGAADPKHEAQENDSDRGNNVKTMTWQGGYRGPATITQELDYARAAAAGAEFNHNIESPLSTCERLGIGRWQDTSWAPSGWTWEHGRGRGPLFLAECAASLVEGHAHPEAFKNFRLKGGWKVQAVERSDPWQFGRFGFELEGPQIGSDSPYVRANIWAGPLPGSYIRVGLHIMIAGPANADPYTGVVSVGPLH